MAKENHGRRVLDSPSDPGRRAVLEQVVGTGVAGALLAGLGAFSVDLLALGQAGAATDAGIALPRGVRRVVTGHNAQGRSYIIQDDRVTNGTFPNMYKATGEQPLGPGRAGEPQKIMATTSQQLEPALGGSSLNFVTLPGGARADPKGLNRATRRTKIGRAPVVSLLALARRGRR